MKLANRTIEEIVVTDEKNRVLVVIAEKDGTIHIVTHNDTKVFLEEETHEFVKCLDGRIKYSPNSEKVVNLGAVRERRA